MAKKKHQTRRSISISGKMYKRLKAHTTKQDIPVSRFIENLLDDYFARLEMRSSNGQKIKDAPFTF